MILNTSYPIETFVPQRPPMLLLSRIITATEESIDSEWDIPADCLFIQDNHLQPTGLMEHAAQTAAALTGVRCKAHEEEVRIGYIGEIRQAMVYSLPAVGDTLHTHLAIQAEVGDISLVSVVVRQGEETIMECQLKIFLSDAD